MRHWAKPPAMNWKAWLRGSREHVAQFLSIAESPKEEVHRRRSCQDEHLGAVNVGAGISKEFVERRLIPGDGRRLECGRIVEPGFGTAVAAS
jgi:hypothetical protein